MGEVSDLPARKIRRKIHKELGINSDERTSLDKKTLNSLAAYFIGELPIRPDLIYAPFVDHRADLQMIIAQECSLADWMHDHKVEGNTRQFNKQELIEILETMESIRDRREWSGQVAEIDG